LKLSRASPPARSVNDIVPTNTSQSSRDASRTPRLKGPGSIVQPVSINTRQEFPIRRRVSLPGHFSEPVILEDVRPIGSGFECRVRHLDGSPDETVLTAQEAEELLRAQVSRPSRVRSVSPEPIRLLIESSRIRLAYAHDRHFAVSLSGIRTLPHQIEAVYLKMLPQPRLRFLLADDPGAGKTIMAGLLIKELLLRGAVDRVLILAPAPLTIQWQDELLKWFDEAFEIVDAARDKGQLINPWQKEPLVISSLDYAKQEDVRERVWGQHWDLVVIDEAHKCSARTKSSVGRSDEVDKTRRYQLAEGLAARSDNLLLLTATPHHGDDDRFAHFVRLIDPDLFPEPHRLGNRSREIRREVLRLGRDCPWALRRLKEDLKDVRGRRLFPDRHAHTVTFQLSGEEYELYTAVTEFINRFLPQRAGARKTGIALARTVFQRRLASSTRAIYESMRRRLERQVALLHEFETLPSQQRSRLLQQLQGSIFDPEQDEDDLDDVARDRVVDEFAFSAELDQLRSEIAALQELVAVSRRLCDQGVDSKLAALKECLARAEFSELSDGRGKLLIFTEHRDTLTHVKENLERWGYSTCEIHGGMNPHQRKRAQEDFRTERQVCVATEAAGEGINLQFCRLMINYDLPWNPTRLEQRLGRIHRIGQERDVHAFNFVASASKDGHTIIEGRILERLLEKLEQMRLVLADRVFDVVGEVLSLNDVNLPEMLREAINDPRRLGEYLEKIERLDAWKLTQYEDATGIALARANVDFSAFQKANADAEERRLMPRYVEQFFLAAADEVGVKMQHRADGLLRVERVPSDIRSDRLEAVRRLGKPAPSYPKLTFQRADLDQDRHLDAVLLGPGHSLYAALDEKLNETLLPLVGQAAVYSDPTADSPYQLHFFEMQIKGQNSKGEVQTLYGELCCVREDEGIGTGGEERFSVVAADCLLDLAAHPNPPSTMEAPDPAGAMDYLKGGYQTDRRLISQQERKHFVDVCREHLIRSFDARMRFAQDRVMQLRAREAFSSDLTLARQVAEAEVSDLTRARQDRLIGLERLLVARHGPVRHLATALVLPEGEGPTESDIDFAAEMDPILRRRSEKAAEDVVEAYEHARGWECERVGHLKIGFDIRSMSPPDSQTGYRDPVLGIRRIEVKGRRRGGTVRLTWNEWNKAVQLGESYWLYVVWDPLGGPNPEPTRIQNPAKHLEYAKREITSARYVDLPADAIESVSATQWGAADGR